MAEPSEGDPLHIFDMDAEGHNPFSEFMEAPEPRPRLRLVPAEKLD